LEPEIWSGNRNRQLWKQTCIRAALSVSTPHNHHSPISTLLDIPLRPRTPPLRIHRTLTTNNQHPQIRMSDVGRPPMGRHQRHLRRKSEQRARLSRLEKFLGRRARRCRERRHGDSEHFCRTRTGKTMGNWSVSRSGEFKSRSYRRRARFFFFSVSLNTNRSEKTGHPQTTPSTYRNCISYSTSWRRYSPCSQTGYKMGRSPDPRSNMNPYVDSAHIYACFYK